MNTTFERTAGKDEWITPKFILDALAPFDLDPCAPVVRPWPMAANHFTVADDGLTQPWRGFVWCNPPYGRETAKWFRKLRAHGNGIALTFARTETKMFFENVWGGESQFCFFKADCPSATQREMPAAQRAHQACLLPTAPKPNSG